MYVAYNKMGYSHGQASLSLASKATKCLSVHAMLVLYTRPSAIWCHSIHKTKSISITKIDYFFSGFFFFF